MLNYKAACNTDKAVASILFPVKKQINKTNSLINKSLITLYRAVVCIG